MTSKCACVAAGGACGPACSCKVALCTRRATAFLMDEAAAVEPTAAATSPPPPPPAHSPEEEVAARTPTGSPFRATLRLSPSQSSAAAALRLAGSPALQDTLPAAALGGGVDETPMLVTKRREFQCAAAAPHAVSTL